ncbi:MAG: CDP-alcohol phosphatidyltransferase family protein [Chlamydiales bacterium]
MKKVHLIPSGITAFGLSIGLFVIFKTSLADPDRGLFSLLQASSILLLIAGMADLADGMIARLIKAESEFGGQFDSLSDSVTFGVTPPLLVLKSFTGGERLSSLMTLLVIVAAMIYTLCGVLRLVRYNVASRITTATQKHFTGLPIPAAAAAVLSVALILISPFVEERIGLSITCRSWILISVLILLGYFMVSHWKFPSAKVLHFRVHSFYLVFAIGVFAVLMLYGVLDYFAEVFFIVSWLYLIIGWSLSIIRLLAGKRSKMLVDFEPDQDDP